MGAATASLTAGSLQLSVDSTYEVELDGRIAGVDYDQIVINANDANDGVVRIDGALLDFSLGFVPDFDTEFVLIANDSSDDIDGRFSTLIGTDGSRLAAARTLQEGDVVFDSSIGSAETAYITYFGGDGNDVAIVVGGDHVVESQGVTLLSRRGSNLEIRVGDSLAVARAASPTVRPIAGLNGNDLIVRGTDTVDDQLFLDFDRFVDPQGINFAGTIVFTGGEGAGDADRLVVFDSDLATDDAADSVSYTTLAARSGVIDISPKGDLPDVPIEFSGSESVDQLIDAGRIRFAMSDAGETLFIDQDTASPNLFAIQTLVGSSQGTLFTIPGAGETFSISGGDGDDTISFNGIAEGFAAELRVTGGDGFDALTIAAPMTLGNGAVSGNVQLSAESIQIRESISTTGGLSDGTLTIDGGSEIVIGPGTIATGDAAIVIDGNGGTIDTSASTLRSTDSLILRDASSLTLGNVDSPGGTLTLGVDRDIAGAVIQAAGTSVVASRLQASTGGLIDLSNPGNQFEELDIQSNGAISIHDSAGDLRLIAIDSGSSEITISTIGTAVLESAIQSPGSTVQISAGLAIRDFDAADTTAKITADTLILSAGSGGIGQDGTFEVDVDVLTIDTTAGNGNVNVSNPFGLLRIKQVNAGSGQVQLSAVQIEDADDDRLADFTASRLVLAAETGIGSVRPLELSAVTVLSAQTDSGGINLEWTAAGDTVIEQLISLSGGIMLTQRGADTLAIQVLGNPSGVVNIVNEDGAIDIAAGPLISADSVRIQAARTLSIARSLRTTNGSLTLESADSVVLSGNLDTTAAGTGGGIEITAPQIEFIDAQLRTAGAQIMVAGHLTIDGQTRVDSGNQQSARQGGNIEFAGRIRGADAVGDRLLIDARGSVEDGDVSMRGAIGATAASAGSRDLNALEIQANEMTLESAGVSRGDIRLSGSEVILNAGGLRTSESGEIEVNAPLRVLAADVLIDGADAVFLRDNLFSINNPAVVTIAAGQDVSVDGTIRNLAGLTVAATGKSTLNGAVDVSGDVLIDAQVIELFLPSIRTPGNVVFAGEVQFKAESRVDADQVRFDGTVTVEPQLRTEIAAAVVDSPLVSELLKNGGGTLVLSGNSPFTQNARVAAGTLRVLGTFGSAAGDVIVASGARLEGNGRIGADVIVQDGGLFGPGISEADGDIDTTLLTDSLALLAGSRFDVQINGPRVGIDSDQVVVSPTTGDGTVRVDGAILDAAVEFFPLESTEFVIIDNDGVDDVIGRFAGAAEGRIIFGNEDSPGPRAYITYFGGDGNDVSIVTAGNLTINSEGATVVSRRGTNLEVRTADTFANAQLADPEIRPIGALNGNELRIVGRASDDALFVDVDRFVEPNLQGINYSGTIVFTAQQSSGPAEQDQLVLFDSDPATDDSLEKIRYAFTSLDDGLITVDPRSSDQNFRVQFSDLELIDQPVDAARLEIITSDLAEQITVEESAGLIPIQVTSGGVSGTQLSIPTPRDSFTLDAGGGDDTLQVNNLSDVRSEVVIDGGADSDSLTLATSLSLGQGDITGNAELSAETLRVQNSIDTTGGDTDGNVLLSGGTTLTFDPGAAVFSGNGTITIDGNGGIIDATGGFVRSLSSGDAVVIGDASRVTLCGIETPNGTTVIGVDGDITGPVSQAFGVSLITDRLTISTNAAVNLSNGANEIRIVDADQRGGPIAITDAVDDLTVSGLNSAGQRVDVISAGVVRLDNNAINATGADVTISGASIEDFDRGDDLLNISAATVSLIAADGIGLSGPLHVNASQSVSASTADSGVRLANPAGVLPIGSIDAGTAAVELQANRVEDASADDLTDITAGEVVVLTSGGIGTLAALELTSGVGPVQLFADGGVGVIDIAVDGDVSINGLVSENETESAARLVARSGAIIDGGDRDFDIGVRGGTVTLQSDFGIGAGDPLETSIAILNARSLNMGGIEIEEIDDITLASVDTHDGPIVVSAQGSITALEVSSQNVSGVDRDDIGDPHRRDVSLFARGQASDILVGHVSARNTADVSLLADDDVLDLEPSDERRVEADDLRVLAGNAVADQAAAVDLSTAVDDLVVVVMSGHRGDIEIRELDTIRLASSDLASDEERMETTNGEIRVFAGQSIRILDPVNANESLQRRADPEIVAAGDHGRIEMRAGDFIEIGNAAQLNAQQSTIEAVVLQSANLVFGKEIEINTGDGIGVARVFSPRPKLAFGGTAFFDFTSVRTTRLEQALVNDAEGVFTVDVGSQGERGLTINIDWGTPFQRFQQIDGLSGDAPPLSVEHLYLEGDILDTRLNGRPSGTAPINVKFAVRHHESILVLGDTVVQTGGVETVAGGVVSSTDNPFTFESPDVQILENGEAQFIIPNLSIPVAFFPIRDVIPVIEQPEILVRIEQTTAIARSTFETVEASVSTLVGRDEYFQIRALSPDPSRGALAQPERLPDDILDGDKLRVLFSKLPDGRYEIEYVLGDGNERPILTVDLRNGKPIIPSGELDGGTLRLRLLNGDTIDLEDAKGDALEKLEPDQTAGDQAAVLIPRGDLTSRDADQKITESAAVVALGTALPRFRRRINRHPQSDRLSAAKRMISRIKAADQQ